MAVLVQKAWVEIEGIILKPKRVKVVQRRDDYDYAEIEAVLDEEVGGKEVCIRLYSSLWGEGCVFLGKVEGVEKGSVFSRILAKDFLYFSKDITFSKTYEGRWTMDKIVSDALSKLNLKLHAIGEFPQVKNFIVDNHSVKYILDYAKRDGKDIYQFPGERKVYYGAPFNREDVREFRYRTGYNVISNALRRQKKKPVGKVVVYIADSLFRYRAVKGEYGQGEPVRVFSFAEDISSVGDARRRAREKARDLYMRLNSDTYEGYVDLFLNPLLRHSDKIYLDGMHYFADKVEHEFSQEGARTKVYVSAGGEL